MSNLLQLLIIAILSLPQAARPQETQDWDLMSKEYEEYRQRWNDQDIDSYKLVMNASCFGCPRYFPARIVVERREVVGVLDPATGEPLRARFGDEQGELLFPARRDRFMTIDALFDIVEDVLDYHYRRGRPLWRANWFEVEYDEDYAYPRAITILYDGDVDEQGNRPSRVTDSNFSYRIVEFVPNP